MWIQAPANDRKREKRGLLTRKPEKGKDGDMEIRTKKRVRETGVMVVEFVATEVVVVFVVFLLVSSPSSS